MRAVVQYSSGEYGCLRETTLPYADSTKMTTLTPEQQRDVAFFVKNYDQLNPIYLAEAQSQKDQQPSVDFLTKIATDAAFDPHTMSNAHKGDGFLVDITDAGAKSGITCSTGYRLGARMYAHEEGKDMQTNWMACLGPDVFAGETTLPTITVPEGGRVNGEGLTPQTGPGKLVGNPKLVPCNPAVGSFVTVGTASQLDDLEALAKDPSAQYVCSPWINNTNVPDAVYAKVQAEFSKTSTEFQNSLSKAVTIPNGDNGTYTMLGGAGVYYGTKFAPGTVLPTPDKPGVWYTAISIEGE